MPRRLSLLQLTRDNKRTNTNKPKTLKRQPCRWFIAQTVYCVYDVYVPAAVV